MLELIPKLGLEDLPAASRISREIQLKTVRIAFLKEFIFDNQMPAFHNVEAGFFTSAAGKFEQMAANCHEVTELYNSIQQLSFDLERVQSEQSELSFVGGDR